ncbi:hypothetical protein EPUS_07624 [Endocarpon pusillum Z07020]|uniref:Uncharacterized protein n=1 Tax=Endocarpon pusillum (strain Z07020 / HMAS-L-300199) TaxID=1263415 RepID=U1I419_ENDPU|nr:uncharacterized protein EPUS_07624 [Endocarpon pusillum Z07020]ERF76834.1 hypothetical protein EPUS_07624 [Endocarpon pusillum Z07020]
MFGPRRGPTLIGITQEDIDMVVNRYLETTTAEEPSTAEAPLPVSPTNIDPAEEPTTTVTAQAPLPVHPTNIDPASNDNNTADASSVASSELVTQLPYEHLPYGREREEIVMQNLQISHLEEMDQQFNSQRAITNAAIEGMAVNYDDRIEQLTEEIRSNRLAIQILTWRNEVLTELANPDQATDLEAEKYADLRQPEIRRLRAVGPAEAYNEKAMKVEMNPPVSTVLGIEGQGYLGRASAGRLYGAEEGLAVFSSGEFEASSEGDARAGTASVSSGYLNLASANRSLVFSVKLYLRR